MKLIKRRSKWTKIPKVSLNEKNELIYISRSLIPGSKSKNDKREILRQVCIYAFTKNELELYFKFGRKSKLEDIEDIEILRFFELDKKVMMVPVSDISIAVDVPSDVEKVENYLNEKNDFKQIWNYNFRLWWCNPKL